GIAPLGAIDRNDGHRTVALDEYGVLGHFTCGHGGFPPAGFGLLRPAYIAFSERAGRIDEEFLSMIDHISVAVRDLAASGALYDAILPHLELKRLVTRDATFGYGKRYPEFWLNFRATLPKVSPDTGAHICLRAPSEDAVRAFFENALARGCFSAGDPGP